MGTKKVIELDGKVILPVTNQDCVYGDDGVTPITQNFIEIMSNLENLNLAISDLNSGTIASAILNNIDLDNITSIDNGFFYVQGAINSPCGTNFCLINYKTSRGSFQFVMDQEYKGIYFRTAWATSIPTTSWNYIPINPQVDDRSNVLVTFGDSMTAQTTMISHLSKNIGMQIADVSVGGTRMSNGVASSFTHWVDGLVDGDYSGVDSSLTGKLETAQNINWDNVKAITVFFGTNDWSANVPIGDSGSTDPATFLGAFNYCLQALYNTYPHINIYVIAPLFRDRFWPGDGKNSDITQNSLGLYLNDYVTALKDEAKKMYKLKVLDLYNESGINLYNSATKTIDGLHADGQYIARQIANFIRNY